VRQVRIQVLEKVRRRRFTAEYKASVLREYEATPKGERGALLRREGPHAWLLLDDHVVDFTAAVPGAPARGTEPPQLIGASEHRTYVGVRFRRDYVLRRTRETGRLAALINDWEHAFPLLRCPPAYFRDDEHGGRS